MNSSRNQPAALFESDVITLIPWTDHHTEIFGHDPRSAYVERFWLGTLGPSTTWFLRHCASLLEDAEEVRVNLRETAIVLGIGFESGARSAMVKTVSRACRFRTARPVGATTLAVRLRLPLLSHGQPRRMPEDLQQSHDEYMSATATNGAFLSQQPRARQVALSLVECGDSISETELELGRMRFHPAVAADAVRWAWSHHYGRVPKHAQPEQAQFEPVSQGRAPVGVNGRSSERLPPEAA